MSDAGEQWRISHQIPIALLLALLMQTGGAFWWGSKVDATLQHLTQRMEEHRSLPRHNGQEQVNNTMQERVLRLEIVVEQQTSVMREQSETLKQILAVLAQNRNK